MAVIQISAIPAKFEDGMMSLRLSLVAQAPYRVMESNKADEIVREMEAFRDEMSAQNPEQGLYVSARKVSGRAPNGFKAIQPIQYKPSA